MLLDTVTNGLFGYGGVVGANVKECERLVEVIATEMAALKLWLKAVGTAKNTGGDRPDLHILGFPHQKIKKNNKEKTHKKTTNNPILGNTCTFHHRLRCSA